MSSNNTIKPPARYLDSNYKKLPISNICELNEYCLAEILKYLNDDDLENFSKTNEYFQSIVGYHMYNYFVSKGIKKFKVTRANKKNNEIIRDVVLIKPCNLKLFGFYVKELEFRTSDEKTIENVLAFCPNVEQLTIIKPNKSSLTSNIFGRPLEKLKVLSFVDCTKLSFTITDLQSWCPHIQQLEFINCKITGRGFLNHHFANLQHFKHQLPYKNPVESEKFQRFIELNPQLKSLSVDTPQMDIQLIEIASKKLRDLKSVNWRLSKTFNFTGELNNTIIIPGVHDVQLDGNGSDWNNVMIFASHCFPSMKSLNITTSRNKKSIFHILPNIMHNMESLTIKLKYFQNGFHDWFEIRKMSSSMPNLKKLSIINTSFELSACLYCFEYFHKLESFELNGYAGPNYLPFHAIIRRVPKHGSIYDDIDVSMMLNNTISLNESFRFDKVTDTVVN